MNWTTTWTFDSCLSKHPPNELKYRHKIYDIVMFEKLRRVNTGPIFRMFRMFRLIYKVPNRFLDMQFRYGEMIPEAHKPTPSAPSTTLSPSLLASIASIRLMLPVSCNTCASDSTGMKCLKNGACTRYVFESRAFNGLTAAISKADFRQG